VRLRHPEYPDFQYATHYTPATYSKDEIDYQAVIDLGDPDQIQAFSAEYTLEILVGDEILPEVLTW